MSLIIFDLLLTDDDFLQLITNGYVTSGKLCLFASFAFCCITPWSLLIVVYL